MMILTLNLEHRISYLSPSEKKCGGAGNSVTEDSGFSQTVTLLEGRSMIITSSQVGVETAYEKTRG